MSISLSELPKQLFADTSIYIALILSVLALFFLQRIFKKRSNLNLPPSPPKLPIIGNLHQLIGKLPHRYFHSLSEIYGPLMLLHLGQYHPTLVISSAEIVEEIVREHDVVISNRPSFTSARILWYGCEDFGFAPYGEYWRKARKICVSELLSNKRVESFGFVREEEVALLVEKLRHVSSDGRSSINLGEMLLATSHAVASRCFIGLKTREEDEKLGMLSKRYATHLSDFGLGDLFPCLGWVDDVSGLIGRLKATFKEMDDFLDSVIEQRKRNDGKSDNMKDFVQILLNLQKDGMVGLSQQKIKAILLDMFVAAVESTASTIEWVMAELVKNPRIMQKVQEEIRRVVDSKMKINEVDVKQMKYLKCIIKETLRLHPTAPLMTPRETSARINLRGYDILPKTKVLVNVWAIQRDPKLWDRPEDFVPERFDSNPIDFGAPDFDLIPFGVGRRGCPGISFGIAVVEYITANLLCWFDWKLPDNVECESLDMSEAFGIAAHKKFPLHLVPNVYGC